MAGRDSRGPWVVILPPRADWKRHFHLVFFIFLPFPLTPTDCSLSLKNAVVPPSCSMPCWADPHSQPSPSSPVPERYWLAGRLATAFSAITAAYSMAISLTPPPPAQSRLPPFGCINGWMDLLGVLCALLLLLLQMFN